jgi:hypothetical protein
MVVGGAHFTPVKKSLHPRLFYTIHTEAVMRLKNADYQTINGLPPVVERNSAFRC